MNKFYATQMRAFMAASLLTGLLSACQVGLAFRLLPNPPAAGTTNSSPSDPMLPSAPPSVTKVSLPLESVKDLPSELPLTTLVTELPSRFEKVHRLVLEYEERQFNAPGQSLQLRVLLLDVDGNLLDFSKLPLRFSSSDSLVFSVDASGKVTAMANDGFSMIEAQLEGTDLKVTQVFKVQKFDGGSSNSSSSGGSGGGGGGGDAGGGGNEEPLLEDVSGDVIFQFLDG